MSYELIQPNKPDSLLSMNCQLCAVSYTMQPTTNHPNQKITERLRGIVERITFHNADSGWSVLRVRPLDNPHQIETVIVHQTRVFAGATMEFEGAWTVNAKYGRQFTAVRAAERRPASSAALEKYLGSGLIKGVGPKTAKKIVGHFKKQTLAVFEEEIERLVEVPGIARKKLESIRAAWVEHRAIREVMMFLQSHGISTLFAVRIYKAYGDAAIETVREDPYCLARDIFGIGFFSADRVALSIGLAHDSRQRIMAGIAHVLAASRGFGHCYLTEIQIDEQVRQLLELDLSGRLTELLAAMEAEGRLMVRTDADGQRCFYAKSLYYAERTVAGKVAAMDGMVPVDQERVRSLIQTYCKHSRITLSDEQAAAIERIVGRQMSVLTGGPGVGKTTTTLVLVKLLEKMGRQVLLAAPTGRAAQRMSEVIGQEAKTIHRLLGWQQGRFKHNADNPLAADFLIVDECSMLDISLTADLLSAAPHGCQVLMIGDADQLPSVGAGNVLRDIIASKRVPSFRLTRIFRQAARSAIIQYAHQINAGELPYMESPFAQPKVWTGGCDCFFMDSDEATQAQLAFVARVKRAWGAMGQESAMPADTANPYEFRVAEKVEPYASELTIPKQFAHVDIEQVVRADGAVEELAAVLKKVHPWSSLRYGLAAVDTVRKLILEWVPRYYGNDCDVQVLSPMTRGTLGTLNLNRMIQAAANPETAGKAQLTVGERIFRVDDRVIHRRNNYDLNVFNGDIGRITAIDTEQLTCTVVFAPGDREVIYQREDITELDLAYAITIHKSQGSEFEVVILPVLTQHFKMLYRNLIYTGLTRARRLAVLVGTRQALAMAVHNQDTSMRQTALAELLRSDVG